MGGGVGGGEYHWRELSQVSRVCRPDITVPVDWA